MADTPTQTYQTHVRRTPALYNAAFLVLLVNVLWTAYRVTQLRSVDALLALLVAIALVVIGAAARTQTLTVQNRVIRLEERRRYERLLTPELAARAATLPVRRSWRCGLRAMRNCLRLLLTSSQASSLRRRRSR